MKLFSRFYRSKASVSAEEEDPDHHPPASSPRQLQRGAKKMKVDSASARWRPGLEAIMEDGIGVGKLEGKVAKRTEKKSKVKSSGTNARYDGDGYFSRNSSMQMAMRMFSFRNSSMQMAMRMFSAAPF